jgi:hypothetical protein
MPFTTALRLPLRLLPGLKGNLKGKPKGSLAVRRGVGGSYVGIIGERARVSHEEESVFLKESVSDFFLS